MCGPCYSAWLYYEHRTREQSVALVRANQMKIRFGITVEQYDALEAKQGGLCAICRRPCPSGRKLAVDHDHLTGRVRGLLCMNCNQGLGKFDDDPGLLRAAEVYLEEGRS